MEAELLKQIAKNTEHKTSFQIIVSNNESSFNTRFNPKLELDRVKVYEIALVNLETYYSFLNIDETNTIFVYSPDSSIEKRVLEHFLTHKTRHQIAHFKRVTPFNASNDLTRLTHSVYLTLYNIFISPNQTR